MASITDRLLAAVGVKKLDPVCGMYIRPAEAAATSQHEGRIVYFCAAGCKEDFDADPSRYA